jgi:hypothetical protein
MPPRRHKRIAVSYQQSAINNQLLSMKKLLPVLLPAAVLALASCSSEPSDWRPEKKVSLDMIPPGTRPSDNFDQGTNEAPGPDKGGAIPRPVSSNPVVGGSHTITPGEVMSSDTQEGTAEPRGEREDMQKGDAKQPGATGTAGAPGTAGANTPSNEQPSN